MFGPHFYYDLIRLARKPRNYYLRGAYLVALLIGWWWVYQGSLPLGDTINDFARLARNFTFALLSFQYAMILLLAPIYLAGTIVEERESRTLELLYQTQLTDRDILLGKFAARVVHLMFFTLMSLPMLAIISLWGGVDIQFLLLHFFLSLLLILLVGSMCLWVSVTATRYTEAMMLAYTLEFAIAYGGGMPLMAIIMDVGGREFPFSNWDWTVLLAAAPLIGGTVFFYYIALVRFRKLRNLDWVKRTETPPRRLPRPRPKPKTAPARPRRRRQESTARTIPDHSLLWKETEYVQYAVDFPVLLVWLGLAAVAVLAALFVLCRLTANGNEIGVMLQVLAVMAYLGLLGMVYLSIAFQATSAVANERERGTLDFLLLLPIERWQILMVKWIAPWIRHRTLLLTTFAIPLIGMVSTMFPARNALMMLLLPWPMLLLINALGLYLSVVCRRTVTANIVLVAVLVGIFILHLLAWSGFERMLAGYFNVLIVAGGEHRMDEVMRQEGEWLILAQQAFFLLLAALFARLAFWRFNMQTAT